MTTKDASSAPAAREEFPPVIPHQPSAGATDDDPLPFASDRDGTPVAFATAGTDCVHMLVTGNTGTGLTVVFRVIALEAARRGINVRMCCVKPHDAAGFRDWPKIVAGSTVLDMIKLIRDTFDDMMRRYEEMEAGRAEVSDYPRILLAIDNYLLLTLLLADWWAQVRGGMGRQQPKEHPAIQQVRALLVMARGARINVMIATPTAGDLPAGTLDNCGTRLALGCQTEQAAQAMFGDATVGCDIPLGSAGQGTALTGAGLADVKAHWLPDPAGYRDGPPPEADALLRAMLPDAPAA